MAKGSGQTGIYESDLARNAANSVPLSPVSFLRRAAAVYPDKTAIVHGAARISYRDMHERACRLASALAKRGIGKGDTVAIMAPNVPAMLEAHYGVPMLGAVLNALNIRLDAKSIAFVLEHGEAKVLITDREFSGVVKDALGSTKAKPLVIDIDDALADGGELLGELDYETFLAEGEPAFEAGQPEDEWQSISLLYTSGTTGNPKGVVYHHRGAYLNAVGNMITFGLGRDSVYLWTLPMFHCNGWTFTWAVTAAAATHVCLRKVDPALIYPDDRRAWRDPHVRRADCADRPGPRARGQGRQVRADRRDRHWRRRAAQRGDRGDGAQRLPRDPSLRPYGVLRARHGLRLATGLERPRPAGALRPHGPPGRQLPDLGRGHGGRPGYQRGLPWDGETMGELMLRGNTVMKGYLKNPQATETAFAAGWFHTGDLAVRHSDGYVEVKDRSKDIIISGGENISSLEVEETLYRYPKVMEAAVVARPDEKWGESPCAFVTLKPGESAKAEEIIAFCRDNMAHYKAPRTIVFGPLPKTSTGKIQKFVLRDQAKGL